jgi:hypothetical protein
MPPAAVLDTAGSLRTSCLDAHARDRELSPLDRELPVAGTRADLNYQR